MMATYFNGGSEIQTDNLQTLYLMNRGGGSGYASYSDAGQSPGVLLLNPVAAASSSQQPNALPQGTIHHAPNLLSHHHHHHLVGIPLAGTASPAGDDPSRPSLHEFSGQPIPRFHYNLWGSAVADPSPSSSGHHTQIPTAIAVSSGGDLGSPMGFRHPSQGGLSLSLNNSSPHKSMAGPVTAVLSPGSGTPTSASAVTSVVAGGGTPGGILGSKYLKAAQELLDEVVNVGKAIHVTDGSKDKAKAAIIGVGEGSSGGGGVESGGGKGGGVATELTTAQRQELQMKKAKLLNMLDEVEQRYRQYHSQMQAVAGSFEQAAGPGSARSYTALALQTISRQFRCLKDAISTQIKATGRSLGEESEEEQGRLGEGSGVARSRLRMVDNQLRQQRALQQLGMMHHNAWRPQRGLPERAVSVLRAWLFEHFLHPYPKDSDKHMLAKQTGLTRSQVSNWFINARVRLWKPMVEEMYLEETKSHEQQNPSGGGGGDVHPMTTATTTPTATAATPRSPKTLHFNQNPHPIPTVNDLSNASLLSPNNSSPTTTLHSAIGPPHHGFSLIGSSEADPKRQRLLSSSDVIHNLNSSSPSSILTSSMDHHTNKPDIKPGNSRDLFQPDLSGFGPYQIENIGSRFNPDHLGHHQYHHGNTVSLTLGLPHCDQSLSLAGTHHPNFQPDLCGIDTSQPPHSNSAYDGGGGGINDVQNRSSWRSTLI